MTYTTPHRFLMSLIFLVGMFSCQKNSDSNPQSADKNASFRIKFDRPAIGQKTRYILFRGANYRDANNLNFEYLKDTLELEIVGKDSALGWNIREKLTAGSVSLHGESNVAYPDSEFKYFFKSEGYIFLLNSRDERISSRIFFLEKESNYPYLTLLDYQSPEVDMKGWKTSLPYAENYRTAYTKNYNLLGITYPHLNVVINNTGMQTQSGLGNTHIYSSANGLVRSTQYNRYTQQGYGWDLIP